VAKSVEGLFNSLTLLEWGKGVVSSAGMRGYFGLLQKEKKNGRKDKIRIGRATLGEGGS